MTGPAEAQQKIGCDAGDVAFGGVLLGKSDLNMVECRQSPAASKTQPKSIFC